VTDRQIIHWSPAAEWFAGVFPGGRNNKFLRVSAARLGGFGVLTLLQIF
jgi:hypothetical protein